MLRNRQARCFAAALATVVLCQGNSHSPVFAQENSLASSRDLALSAGDAEFVVGDRLRISLFERVEQEDDAWATRRRSGRPDQSFYPRQDITGEFVIQPDGTLPVPLLGNIPAEGRTGQALATAIATAFEAVVGRPAKVTQALVERPPISVVGPVRQPGVFRHADGMSVLYALALAGGLRRTDDSWSKIELVKEQAKLPAAKERNQRLQIEVQLLRAERDGTSDQDSLRELGAGAPALVEEIRNGRMRIRQAYHERRAAFETGVAAAKEALEIAQERHEATETAVQQREERVQALKQLTDKNNLSRPVFLEASVQLSDARERKLATAGLVAEAKLRLSSVQVELSRFDLETRIETDRLLAQRLQEAAEAKTALESSEAIIASLAPDHESDAHSTSAFSFEIIRRIGERWETFFARPTTVLKPGDLVRVDINRGRLAEANQ